MSGSHFPSELFIARFTQSSGILMPELIERVLAHLILPSLSKSNCLLSSRQASVQPNDHSIGLSNVKHKSGGLQTILWKK
jgi:hypothetical protein